MAKIGTPLKARQLDRDEFGCFISETDMGAAKVPLETRLKQPSSWIPGAQMTIRALILALALPLVHGAVCQTPSPASASQLEAEGRLPEAEQAWRAVVAANPQDARAYAALGVVLSKEAKYDDAASAYRKALALNPRLPGIDLNLALAEFKRGRCAEAVAPLKAALEADPANTQVKA